MLGALLLLSLLPGSLAVLPPCPASCACFGRTGQVLCRGGSYQRFPVLPHGVQGLSWSGLRLTSFSLSDLPRSALRVSLRGLQFQRLLPDSSGIPAKTERLEVQGCCGDRFPSLADYQSLKDFSYDVSCGPTVKGVDINSPAMQGLGSDLAPASLRRFRASACIANIDVPSLQLLLRYRKLNLDGNRLMALVSGSMAATGTQTLSVSHNPQLSIFDIGRSPLSLKRLEVSDTRLHIQRIAADGKTLRNFQQRDSSTALDLGWLCSNFPKLVRLDVGSRSNVSAAGVGRCKYLDVLIIDRARQTAIPDLRTKPLLHFLAAHNRYRLLDLNLFPGGVAKINVSANAIERVVVNSTTACRVLEGLDMLDLSGNNLTTLTKDFLRCLPNNFPRKRQTLNISDNPLTELFSADGRPVLVSRLVLYNLNISGIASIRERGIFPSWLLANFLEISELTAERNRLISLPRILALLKAANLQATLHRLRLGNNRFSEIPNLHFLGFQHLQTLSLANNVIRTIGNEAFVGLDALLHLDLSGNRLVVPKLWTSGLRPSVRALFVSNPIHCSCAHLQALANVSSPGAARPTGIVCAAPTNAALLPLEIAIERRDLMCGSKDRGSAQRNLFSSTWVILALVVGVVLVALVSALLTRCLMRKSNKYSITSKHQQMQHQARSTPSLHRHMDPERMGMMPPMRS